MVRQNVEPINVHQLLVRRHQRHVVDFCGSNQKAICRVLVLEMDKPQFLRHSPMKRRFKNLQVCRRFLEPLREFFVQPHSVLLTKDQELPNAYRRKVPLMSCIDKFASYIGCEPLRLHVAPHPNVRVKQQPHFD
jgi:hypothetical protein